MHFAPARAAAGRGRYDTAPTSAAVKGAGATLASVKSPACGASCGEARGLAGVLQSTCANGATLQGAGEQIRRIIEASAARQAGVGRSPAIRARAVRYRASFPACCILRRRPRSLGCDPVNLREGCGRLRNRNENIRAHRQSESLAGFLRRDPIGLIEAERLRDASARLFGTGLTSGARRALAGCA